MALGYVNFSTDLAYFMTIKYISESKGINTNSKVSQHIKKYIPFAVSES